MKLLNFFRYHTWALLEKRKSHSILNHIKEIEKEMTDDEYYYSLIDKKISNILNYATQNTEFYANFQDKSINEWPVINKKIIMENEEDFRSKEFENSKIHTMATSGSTGIPFKVEQDMAKRNRVLAEIIYFSSLLGYKVGSKLIYLRNKESMFVQSKLKAFIKNEDIIATQKYDDETLGKIVNEILKKEKNSIILGYASTLQMLATYMNKHNIVAKNICGVISGAEAITHKTRTLVAKQFGCHVVSRYSNQEMGILAQDLQEDHFELNRGSYYFELLDLEKDVPAEMEEIGRIVVTDLYNHAMPMIRYDTGDLGIIKKDEQGRYYLAKVLGRKLDLLYTTANEPITFFAFDEYFESNFDIEQYQIVQHDRTHLTVNLILKEGKTIDENWCKERVKEVMGADCNVTICYLDQTPVTDSGKFRYVICNYIPQ